MNEENDGTDLAEDDMRFHEDEAPEMITENLMLNVAKISLAAYS